MKPHCAEMLDKGPHIVLLDIGMPPLDGWSSQRCGRSLRTAAGQQL